MRIKVLLGLSFMVLALVVFFGIWKNVGPGDGTASRIRQKAESAKVLIQEQAKAGAAVDGYLRIMRQAKGKFDQGDYAEGEALLDEALAILRLGEPGEFVNAAADGPSSNEKAEEAKRLIKQRAGNGENVSGYLDRMKKVSRHFKKGEIKEGEALLDEVLADLRSKEDGPSQVITSKPAATSNWSTPERVKIKGYDGRGDHKMEVGVTADGKMIFFNNSNHKPAKTDIFYATRVGDDDTLFEFRGPIAKANKPGVLDATPAYDNRTGKLSFVSSRVRPPALYWGEFANGELRNLESVPLSFPNPYYALDMELGGDRNTIVFTYRSWRDKAYMEISIAEWDGERYVRRDDWQQIMANVNTDAMEYAPDISNDLLELWFTRLQPGGTTTIYGATRNKTSEPFTNVARHPTITGVVEAPTLTGDDNTMYYHCVDKATKTIEVCVVRRQ